MLLPRTDKPNDPKAHHFVPRALLRPFADGEERLWHYNKRRAGERVSRQHINSVFFRNHLYATQNGDGTRNVGLERAYANLEGRIAPLFARITDCVLQERLPLLTEAERTGLRFFIHQQWRRVPELFDRILPDAQARVELSEALDSFEKKHRPLTDEERQRFQSAAVVKRMWQDARVKSLASSSAKIDAILATKNVVFGLAPASRSFIVASQPVQKIVPGKAPNDLDHSDVEVWLAIHPRVLVALAGKSADFESIVSMGQKAVRNYNRVVAAASAEFASSDERLVRSLADYLSSRATE